MPTAALGVAVGAAVHLMDHSVPTVLIGPEGDSLGHFTIEVTAEEMAERIRENL